MGYSPIITETASTIASQTLMGMILVQTSLKHKNHNELNNKKEKINMQTHARMKIFHKPKKQKKFLQTHKLKIILNHSFLSF
ncbi:hypothetical protein JP0129_01010 [Helicobacter pylori]|nr:hypothetical protein JP0129_01010 [Helicobacter pylori]